MRGFVVTTDLPHPPERVYDVSLDIDAHVASMAASGERAIGGVTSGQIAVGESVTWSARHFGIRWRMTSKITAADRPHRFVDEQVRGPFRTFHHEHVFEEVPGGTRMIDTISLRSPIAGFVVEPVVLIPYLRRLIRQRNEHLRDVLGSGGAAL